MSAISKWLLCLGYKYGDNKRKSFVIVVVVVVVVFGVVVVVNIYICVE